MSLCAEGILSWLKIYSGKKKDLFNLDLKIDKMSFENIIYSNECKNKNAFKDTHMVNRYEKKTIRRYVIFLHKMV